MKGSERQQQILRCAKRVFAERGFHAANISHICKAAGIGRGTLYQYFGNKKAVFTALLREVLDRVTNLMREQRTTVFPPPQSLRRRDVVRYSARRLRRLLDTVFDDERTLRILLREAPGLDVDVENILGEIDDSFIGIVERDLIEWQRVGVVRPLDARITATLMVGGIEKLALTALRGEAPVDLDVLANEAVRLHILGLLSDLVQDSPS